MGVKGTVAEGSIMPTRRIRTLADELSKLISHLEVSEDHDDVPEIEVLVPTTGDWLKVAQEAYNIRRYREKTFGSSQLFGEPTWDILLDLFIAELKNTKMQTTSVCIGAQVPQTTALRWITLLEREDLVHRYRDKGDSRRVYIQLTERALQKMVRIFYDRCIVMMANKHLSLERGTLPAGANGNTAAREAILNDAVAQIKIKKH